MGLFSMWILDFLLFPESFHGLYFKILVLLHCVFKNFFKFIIFLRERESVCVQAVGGKGQGAES